MIGKHVVIDTLDNFKTKLSLIPSSAIVLIKDVGQIYAHGTYFGAQKTYSLLTKTADGLAPKGGTSASSLIKDGATEWVLTVTNGENPSWRRLPDNAFNSLLYTLPAATTTELGGIKVGKLYTATFGDLVGKYYKINIDKDGLAYVEVPWTDNDYRVEQINTSVLDEDFRVTFSETASNDTKTETLRKSSKLLFNPVSGKLTSTTFVGNLDGKYINKLTDYSIAKQEAAISINDSLNLALGKLEYKLDSAYNWYKGVIGTDEDKIINKWDEIVDFVKNVSEGTDITDEFVTRKTNLTITGIKTFKQNDQNETTIRNGNIITNVYTWGGWNRNVSFKNTSGDTTVAASFGVLGNGIGSDGTEINHISYLYLAHQDQNYTTATFKVYNSKATINNNEIYHKGNLKNLSDLNDDVVSGKYLPLSGGTLKGSTNTPLALRGTESDTWLGYYDTNGSFFGSIGVYSDNNPYFYHTSVNEGSKAKIWHSGNDGSGSGLDADLLDGINSTGFLRRFSTWQSSDNTKDANNLLGGSTFAYKTHNNTATNGVIVSFNSDNWNSYTLLLLGGYVLNLLYFRNLNGDNHTWGTWNEILHSGNTYISNGTITINGTTITPLTAHQSLANYVTLNTSLTITGVKTFSSLLKFTVALGTAPFTVSSTTKVTNLNADLLDGHYSNSFLPSTVYNYSSGCLVKTTITTNSNTMVTFRIEGNSYNLNNILTVGEFYNYTDHNAIIHCGSLHLGYDFGKITVFCYDGYVYLWFKLAKNYQSFVVTVYATNSTDNNINRVSSITNASIPTSGVTRSVEINPIININSSNYTSYTVKKDGTGASGTWGINISGSCKELRFDTIYSGTVSIWNENHNSLKLSAIQKGIDTPSGYVYGYLHNYRWDSANWSNQLYFSVSDYESRLFTRGYRNDTGSWTSWNTVAFITDNVASATKLQTARTIWGQSFDGTSNITGNLLIGLKDILVSDQESEYTALRLYTDHGLYLGSGTSSKYDTLLWGKNIKIVTGNNGLVRFCVANDGNVGIGTDKPEYKLDVNGSSRFGNVETSKIHITSNLFEVLTVERTGESLSAGIHFKNAKETMGYIGMNSSSSLLRYSPDTTTRYKIWDEGNHGAGSGLNADLLDGIHADEFFQSRGFTGNTLNFNSIEKSGIWCVNSGSNYANYNQPFLFGNVLTFIDSTLKNSYGRVQIGIGSNNFYYRSFWDAKWENWEKLLKYSDFSTEFGKEYSKYSYYDSQRDFTDGTLIKTNIDYSKAQGEPFYGEIKGNTYTKLGSMFTLFLGYIYNNSIINYSITNLGIELPEPLTAMNIDGFLCFWFPRKSYWLGYAIKITSGYNHNINRITSVSNSTKPDGTKIVEFVDIPGKLVLFINLNNSNYHKYTVKQDGTGALGNWAIKSQALYRNTALSTSLDINNFLWSDGLAYTTFSNYPDLGFEGNDGILATLSYSANYGVLLAFDDSNNNFKLRSRNNEGNSWRNWSTIIHSDNIALYMNTVELISNITTILKNLTVTLDWMDTGIKHSDLTTGTYIVQVYVNALDSTGYMYDCYWSGIMSWYSGKVYSKTNDTETDEILLHRSGHAYGNTIYLRTAMSSSESELGLRLQIAANKNIAKLYSYKFTFKKIM